MAFIWLDKNTYWQVALRSGLSAIFILGLNVGVAKAQQQLCNTEIEIDQSRNRLVVNDNGTVSDLKTRLTWRQCPEGLSGSKCEVGKIASVPWKEAMELARTSSFAGFTDWRVPDVKELVTIIDGRCYLPAVDLKIFPRTIPSYFWTSSVYSVTVYGAWSVNFFNGSVGSTDKFYGGFVRLVRGER